MREVKRACVWCLTVIKNAVNYSLSLMNITTTNMHRTKQCNCNSIAILPATNENLDDHQQTIDH